MLSALMTAHTGHILMIALRNTQEFIAIRALFPLSATRRAEPPFSCR